MGVYIPDMKMPHDCRDCPMLLYHLSNGSTECTAARKTVADNWQVIPFDGRPDWCPLEEIPPHGDRAKNAQTEEAKE